MLSSIDRPDLYNPDNAALKEGWRVVDIALHLTRSRDYFMMVLSAFAQRIERETRD